MGAHSYHTICFSPPPTAIPGIFMCEWSSGNKFLKSSQRYCFDNFPSYAQRAVMLFNRILLTVCHKASLRAFISWMLCSYSIGNSILKPELWAEKTREKHYHSLLSNIKFCINTNSSDLLWLESEFLCHTLQS